MLLVVIVALLSSIVAGWWLAAQEARLVELAVRRVLEDERQAAAKADARRRPDAGAGAPTE